MSGSKLDRLREGSPLVLDGTMGTALCSLAAPGAAPVPVDRLNLEDPAAVMAVHGAHVEARAEVLRTNTFSGAERALREHRVEASASALARAGAELALEAARAAEPAPLVLGTVGPGEGPPDADPARVGGLLDGGADAILLETVPGPAAARAMLGAVRAVAPEAPLLLSLTPALEPEPGGARSMTEVAAVAEEFGVALLALNCGHGPRSLERSLSILRDRWSGALGAWPNAGLPKQVGGEWRWPVGPDELAEWCAAAVQRHDLRLVGGCCGSTAAHVRAVARAVGQSGGAGPA